ncbi:MAG TPA: hypothetical protein VFX76_00120 [Roseiflexaceae bacterium]|nr:hypothetical protein [Roseiflexaceae bacterium]
MTDRVALNVRLPKSLHRGLVALAEREYRSLNDQIVAILARTVIDQLDPQRDDLAARVKRFVITTEPFMVLWERLYPERPPRASPFAPISTHSPTDFDGRTEKQHAAHRRLEAASAELIRAFRAWEQTLAATAPDSATEE